MFYRRYHMYKLLMVEDNVDYLKNTINIISSKISDLKLYSMSFNAEEALKIIDEQSADIILLDLKLPGISGIDILNHISKNKLYKYYESILILSGENSLMKNITNNPYIFSYHLKSNGYHSVIKSLESLISLKKHQLEMINIKEKINHELKKLNYNFSYNGTKYLCDTIFEIHKIKEIFEGDLKNTIYPIISKKYNKSINTIYGDIKQATKYMLLDCEENVIIKYFNNTFFIKPKIQDIIFTILNKL